MDAAEANRIFSSSVNVGPEDEGLGYVVGVEDGPGDEDEEYAEMDPNLLIVRVRRARELSALDVHIIGDATSDPFVRLACDGVEHW